jgi:polyhydroxybutyrate depolymerase
MREKGKSMTRRAYSLVLSRMLGALACVAIASYPVRLDAKCKPGDPLAPGDHTYDMEYDGNSRTFLLHVPQKYTGRTPVALVFDLHGSSGTGPGQLAASGFEQVSEEYGFLVVAPTGYMNFWNGDIEWGTAFEMMIDDVGYLKAVVDRVAELANIDRGKVFSTGLSNGAAMSNTLGCQAADTFAGSAPVADPLDVGLPTCMPAQPISVLGFHGYDDEPVPYEGGRGSGPMLPTPFASIPDTLVAWSKLMQCTGTPELISFEGRSKCEIYRDCGGDAQVGYCSLEGGHNLYSQNVMNIADYAWKFFDMVRLPRPDADGDSIGDEDDNCVSIANPDQADADGDCIGDACECEAAADCDDQLFCNGSEACTNGACSAGSAPCPVGEMCAESSKMCGGGVSEPDAGTAPSDAAGGGTTGGGAAGQSGAMPNGRAGATAPQPAAAGNTGRTSSTPAAVSSAGAPGASATDAQPAAAASEGDSGCAAAAPGSDPQTGAFSSLLALLGVSALWSRMKRRRRS